MYVQVITTQVYKYKVIDGEGIGQKGTTTGQGTISLLLRTDPFKKGLITVVKEGLRHLVYLQPTKKPVGVYHKTIVNIVGDVSGLYGVLFR